MHVKRTIALTRANMRAATLAFALATALLSACATEEPPPPPAYPVRVSSFDRSWAAAVAAARDAGVRVTAEDRAQGLIRGDKDAVAVSITVRTQADGSVRVEINTRGPAGQDKPLADQLSRAYDRRMGR
jgi:hypothetical protein